MKEKIRQLRSLSREALAFYKSAIANNIKRVPILIFGFLALFGACMVGLFIGFATAEQPYENTIQEENRMVKEENEKLKNLITEYEDLSELYYEQGVNVAVFTDIDTLQSDPLKIANAMRSMEEYRDLINVQTGRILELRSSAGYSETSTNY